MKLNADTVIAVMTYALAILCVAAGVPKIMQMPQELGFLSNIGFSATGVSILGVLQLAGGVLLFWLSNRKALVLTRSLSN